MGNLPRACADYKRVHARGDSRRREVARGVCAKVLQDGGSYQVEQAINLFIYSFIHSFIYSVIHLFIYSFILLFIQGEPRRRDLEADAGGTRRLEPKDGHLHRQSWNRAQVLLSFSGPRTAFTFFPFRAEKPSCSDDRSI